MSQEIYFSLRLPPGNLTSTTTAKVCWICQPGRALESRMERLEKSGGKEIQYDILSGFLAVLIEMGELPVDFNEKLFHRLVDYAAVYPDGRVVFTFRNGAKDSTKI